MWLMLLLWINIQQDQVTRGGIPDVKKFSLLPTVYETLIPTMYTACTSILDGLVPFLHLACDQTNKQINANSYPKEENYSKKRSKLGLAFSLCLLSYCYTYRMLCWV